MSGIAGVMYLDGRPADPMDLQRMVDAMAHRGPDGRDVWTDGSVGLGHCMLHTTPESLHEELPSLDSTGRYAITADARIDNRADLIQQLELSPREPAYTDSELILLAYRKWSEACVDHLLGDFAFVIYDAERGRIVAARDHFGIRPFFYVHRPGNVVAFASEVKALRAAGMMSGEINESKIAEFLLVPVDTDPAETFWADVSSLQPAHRIVASFDSDSVSQEAYWQLDPTREVRFDSEAEYEHRFKELFDEAVRCRLRAVGPVGSMLSGGMDSTSIACTAANELAERSDRLHTFSAVFDGVPESNERPYIEAAHARYGDRMKPFVLAADEADGMDSPVAINRRSTWFMDRPDEGINAYFRWQLYQGAHQRGVRVMLDGFDGDTTVSHGEGYFHELVTQGRWITLYRELKATVRRLGGTAKHWRRAFRGWIKLYLRQHAVAGPVVRRLRNGSTGDEEMETSDDVLKLRVEGGAWSGTAWKRYIRDEFAGAVADPSPLDDHPPLWESARTYHHMMLNRPLMQGILESINAQAVDVGIENRFPFFDVRLVEYCLALPGRFKRRNGWTRWILMRAMDGVLPREVQWRGDKTNLAPALSTNMRQQDGGALLDFANALRHDENVHKYVHGAAVADLVKRILADDHGVDRRKRESDLLMLTRVLALYNWFDQVVYTKDVEPTPSVSI